MVTKSLCNHPQPNYSSPPNPSPGHSPSLRHCRRMPPEFMLFSCSSSEKLRELAKTRMSVMLMILWRKETACSMERPWFGSSISTSPRGEVAAARSGRSPPHDVTRMSASWEIMWVTLTTKTWFSGEFT